MWHKVPFNCPDCGKPATILNIYSNAEGEVGLEGLCALCGVELQSNPIPIAKLVSVDAVLDYLQTEEGQNVELLKMPVEGRPS